MDDPLTTVRAELKRRRKALDLEPKDAAKLAGLSTQRWVTIERGYEIKQGNRIAANPRRATLITMARAVGWDPGEALKTAGARPLNTAETTWSSADPRHELQQLLDTLSNMQVWALAHVARTMVDRDAVVPGSGSPSSVVVDQPSEGTDPGTYHHKQEIEPEDVLNNESEDDLPQS